MWLEAGSAAAGLPEPVDLLAYHYGQSANTAKQREYLRKAGDAAAAAYANDAALEYLSRALALTPEDDAAERYALLCRREQVYELLGARKPQAEDLQALQQLAVLLDGGAAPVRRAEVAVRRAPYAEVIGDYAQAVVRSREASALAQAAGAMETQVRSYQVWGSTLWHQGEYPAAHEVLVQGLALARAAQMIDSEADCLRSLGVVFDMQGDYVQARRYFEQSQLAHGPARRNLRHEARVLNSLGIVAFNQGDYVAAQSYFGDALQLRHAIGDRYGAGTTNNNLGLLAWQQGDYPAARRYFEEALRLCRELADLEGEAGALTGLGLIAVQAGDPDTARTTFAQAIDLTRAIGDVAGEAEALVAVGLMDLYLGNSAAAARNCRRSLDLAQPVQVYNAQAEAWVMLGHAELAEGRLDEAEDAYRRGAAIRQDGGQLHRALEPLAGLARVARARGAAGAALELVEAILPHLLPGRLDGTIEPFSVYLTCYQVLADHADPRARPLLEQARRELETQAGRIEDLRQRQLFIDCLATRRALAALG
jgi:tetratricopeptide (TPR) repeat protein